MMNLDGIIVALVTPWIDGRGIDDAALERIVAHTCAAGVAAISPGGTTGEGPRLSREERLHLVKQCAALVPPEIGLVGGVTSSSLAETLDELEAQARAGAKAALLTPPSRMPLGADGCRRFYTSIAERTPLPLIIYHIPAFTGVHVPPEVVLELAAHESIIGLKDSSADIQYHLRVADGLVDGKIGDFALLTGTDATMIASMQAGGKGAVLASGNLVPEMGVGVHRAFRNGDTPQALELLRRLRAIVIACRRGSLPAGWKAAMELAGWCSRSAVPSGETLDQAQVDALRGDLTRLGVLV